MSENTFHGNNIHRITVLSSLNFAISFVWVIIKGNRKKQSQEKMKSKRYQEKTEYYLSTDGYKIPFKISSSAMYEARL